MRALDPILRAFPHNGEVTLISNARHFEHQEEFVGDVQTEQIMHGDYAAPYCIRFTSGYGLLLSIAPLRTMFETRTRRKCSPFEGHLACSSKGRSTS